MCDICTTLTFLTSLFEDMIPSFFFLLVCFPTGFFVYLGQLRNHWNSLCCWTANINTKNNVELFIVNSKTGQPPKSFTLISIIQWDRVRDGVYVRLHMYMSVYPCICVFTRVYVRLPVHMCVYPCICAFTRVYVRLPVYMCVYTGLHKAGPT